MASPLSELKSLNSQEKEDLMIRVLEYYAGRIRNVRLTEEGKLGKELIEKDAIKILTDIHEILGTLRNGLPVDILGAIRKNNEVLCDSLTAYESSLETTRESYWKALGCKPKLTNIDGAISDVKTVKSEYCAEHSV